MGNMEKEWIDKRLTEEQIKHLWNCIGESEGQSLTEDLAGNITKSDIIKDKNNWFFNNVLKELVNELFLHQMQNLPPVGFLGDPKQLNITKTYLEENPPEFYMNSFWVNYQKQNEFNPLHCHRGLFSFVVFMQIPTRSKEQHDLPFVKHSVEPSASDFQFVTLSPSVISSIQLSNFQLNPEDEGRMLFFPANIMHQVYPFYGTEKERITISGNIVQEEESLQKMIRECISKVNVATT